MKRLKHNKSSSILTTKTRFEKTRQVECEEKNFFACSHLTHRTLTGRRCHRTSRLALDSARNAPIFYKSSRKILFLVGASRCILIRAIPNERKWLSAFSLSFFLFILLFFISLVRFSNRKYTRRSIVIGNLHIRKIGKYTAD